MTLLLTCLPCRPFLGGGSPAEKCQATVAERQAKSCSTLLAQPQCTIPRALPFCRVSALEAEVQESCREAVYETRGMFLLLL